MDANRDFVFDFAPFPMGLGDYNLESKSKNKVSGNVEGQGYAKVLRQRYSALLGMKVLNYFVNGKPEQTDTEEYFIVGVIGGLPTDAQAVQNLPAGQPLIYTGQAFDGTSSGQFTYSLDLGSRKGSGHISGLNIGNIALLEADLKSGLHIPKVVTEMGWEKPVVSVTKPNQPFPGVIGEAKMADGSSRSYGLGLFGPNAEEVAGGVTDQGGENLVVGFGGSR